MAERKRLMLRALRLRAVATVLMVTVAVAGCYWLRYEEISATHVELMERLALDSRDSLASLGAPVAAGDIQRLRYPLDRARRFEEIVRRRRPSSSVLDALERVCDAYEALVEYLEAMGGSKPEPADISEVNDLAATVAATAAEARAAIRAGRG